MVRMSTSMVSRSVSVEAALLTVSEAAAVLGIGRTLAYQLVRQYEASDGREGLPAIRLGASVLRVPRWALMELALTGRVVSLVDADVA